MPLELPPPAETSNIAQHQPQEARGSIISDLFQGAWDELSNHKGRLAAESLAGIGLAVATAALAPELAVAVAGVGLVAGAYELGYAVHDFMHDSEVIDNRKGQFSSDQVHQAHNDIKDLGANAMDFAAISLGGSLEGSTGTLAKAAARMLPKIDARLTILDDVASNGLILGTKKLYESVHDRFPLHITP
jgi:hypothetical protein